MIIDINGCYRILWVRTKAVDTPGEECSATLEAGCPTLAEPSARDQKRKRQTVKLVHTSYFPFSVVISVMLAPWQLTARATPVKR